MDDAHAPAKLDAPVVAAAPVTEEAFLADRQKFWQFFGTLIKGGVIGTAVVLILLAVFLT